MTQYQIDQEQYDIETQQYFFNLFPMRILDEQLLSSAFNHHHQPLLEMLACKLCLQTLNTPIYLRCSHRFCKECIEKYLRVGFNKCCPICRETLLTRRQAKIDLSMIQFINLFRNCTSIDGENTQLNQENIATISTNRSLTSHSISSLKQQKEVFGHRKWSKVSKNKKRGLSIKEGYKEKDKKGRNRLINESPNDHVEIISVSNSTEESDDDVVEIVSSSYYKDYMPVVLQEEDSEYESSEQDYQKQEQIQNTPSEIETQRTSSFNEDYLNFHSSMEETLSPVETSDSTNFSLESYQFSCLADIQRICQSTKKNAYFYIQIRPYPNKIVPELQKELILCPYDIQIIKIKTLISLNLNIYYKKIKVFAYLNSKFIQLCQSQKLCNISWLEYTVNVGSLPLIIRNLQRIKEDKRGETQRIVYYCTQL